ncbi:hypothetical protein SUGI_0874040 [Cryptomeria japonica]|nr:hypothetical protein SUGI_0874040 [Cryptomeria japonica]
MSFFSFCLAIMIIMLHFHFSCVSACPNEERSYLLDFKGGLKDPSGRLRSWQNFNCCQWEGVTCDYHSGHVVALDLKIHHCDQWRCWEREDSYKLSGKIHDSLFNLQYLQQLDLSWNDFRGAAIPPQLVKFQKLTSLNLAGANFGGKIPPELSNITTLRHLNLSENYFNWTAIPSQLAKLQRLTFLSLTSAEIGGEIPLELGNITALRHLDLSRNYFNGTAIPAVLGKLRRLTFLNLADAAIGVEIPLELGNITTLRHLDLSRNSFNWTAIPPQLEKLRRLAFLDLSYAEFGDEIPPELGNITTLRYLDLSAVSPYFSTESAHNLKSRRFEGLIRNLRSLEYLAMRQVNLSTGNDHWSNALSSLSKLKEIELADCGLSGTMTSLLNLTHLSRLYLSGNPFYSPLPAWFQNVSSLVSLHLYSCSLNGSIPSDFMCQSTLRNLDLSYNYHLGGVIPHCIANFSMLETLYLSNNNLTGDLPVFGSLVGRFSSLVYLDASYNQLSGKIPATISELSFARDLDLSNNQLCGPIPDTISKLSSLTYMDLSKNQLSGTIPDTISELFSLRYLDLSNNQLSGTIPHAISKFRQLEKLLLRSNNFTGSISPFVLEIPNLKEVDLSENPLTLNISSSWIPQIAPLEYIGLRSCNLQGEIPVFLSTQFLLEYVDLSDNNIVGNIPTWLWELPSLLGLNLSHNRLEGSLPPVSKYIWRLDLHNNSLHGCIPDLSGFYLDLSDNKFNGSIPRSICSASNEFMFLDLSKNRLTGVIPTNVVRCSYLHILNLAQNHLEGKIPEELGNLTVLQTLNLNENKMRGVIPPSLENCTKLRVFDVGKNRIQGCLPVWIGKLEELRILNLAFNKLQGTFPPELFSLMNLQILDLSHNNFSGHIPKSLGKLNAMANQTQSDEIEMSLGDFRYASGAGPVLEIMFVNQGKQFATFEASSYLGNANLHGPPLENGTLRSGWGERGGQVQSNSTGVTDNDADADELDQWWAVAVGICFGIGFSSVIAILCFKLKWRYRCFSLLDNFIQYLFEH